MIWVCLVPRQWHKVELRSVGAPGGGSLALVVNPFDATIARGREGRLCTGSTVWSFTVVAEAHSGQDLALELREHESYDELRHGRLHERDRSGPW